MKISPCKGRCRGIFNPVQHDFDDAVRLQVLPVRSRFQLHYQSQKQTLETKISAQREAWSAEELQRAREQKEYEENLKKQRQRGVEDYEYKKALERKKAQDKYEEETRVVEKTR